MTAWKKLEDIRAAFFDVDGTLVSLEQNCEPESTKEALRRLRERHHAVSLDRSSQVHAAAA